MNLAALDDLHNAFAALRIALDGDDMAAVDRATKALRDATETVQAVGAWQDAPELREKLKAIQPLMEAARTRANILADHTRQRLSLLAERGAEGAQLTYGR